MRALEHIVARGARTVNTLLVNCNEVRVNDVDRDHVVEETEGTG